MMVKNMTEFRKSMKDSLDLVSENDETMIISRSDDKDVVIISLSTYNGMQETLYQMASPANRTRLDKAVADVKSGNNIVAAELLP